MRIERDGDRVHASCLLSGFRGEPIGLARSVFEENGLRQAVNLVIYGKLPIVLLSALASQADGTKECMIAEYILAHPSEAARMNIVELAERCHVSISSLSRFCREIGLQDFAELRKIMREADWHYEPVSKAPKAELRAGDVFAAMHSSLERLEKSVCMEEITVLCRKIAAYERVACFGLLKAGMAAQSLQADLLLQGKVTVCKASLAQQLEYMERADERDLILIFSYSGVYFDYLNQCIPQGLHRAHVVFITGAKGLAMPCVDQVIAFDSSLDQASHPFQMQAVAALIAQEYAWQKRG